MLAAVPVTDPDAELEVIVEVLVMIPTRPPAELPPLMVALEEEEVIAELVSK
jgi:hypothetical protein